jgi:hypothetical protein
MPRVTLVTVSPHTLTLSLVTSDYNYCGLSVAPLHAILLAAGSSCTPPAYDGCKYSQCKYTCAEHTRPKQAGLGDCYEPRQLIWQLSTLLQ